MANYFNVSIDYLVGYEKETAESENSAELLRIFNLMTNEQKRIYIEQGKAFIK